MQDTDQIYQAHPSDTHIHGLIDPFFPGARYYSDESVRDKAAGELIKACRAESGRYNWSMSELVDVAKIACFTATSYARKIDYSVGDMPEKLQAVDSLPDFTLVPAAPLPELTGNHIEALKIAAASPEPNDPELNGTRHSPMIPGKEALELVRSGHLVYAPEKYQGTGFRLTPQGVQLIQSYNLCQPKKHHIHIGIGRGSVNRYQSLSPEQIMTGFEALLKKLPAHLKSELNELLEALPDVVASTDDETQQIHAPCAIAS
ncbi:MAG: hypothetical protein CMH98_03645 [Oceanospirillaceae bacterium]|nr:hypothetical protein [Oceanospirillaceae bacterium]